MARPFQLSLGAMRYLIPYTRFAGAGKRPAAIKAWPDPRVEACTENPNRTLADTSFRIESAEKFDAVT